MNAILARRPSAIRHSASIAAKAMVTELREKGREIIDFTIGEPDMDTPVHILDAAARAMRSGQTHYTASNGTNSLRRAVAKNSHVRMEFSMTLLKLWWVSAPNRLSTRR